jgi:hypothetical protein
VTFYKVDDINAYKGDRVIMTKLFISGTTEEICINFVIGVSAVNLILIRPVTHVFYIKLKSDFIPIFPKHLPYESYIENYI